MRLSEVSREVRGMTKSTAEPVGEGAFVKLSGASTLAKLHISGLNAELKPQGAFSMNDPGPQPEVKGPLTLAYDAQPWLVEERKERCVTKREQIGNNPPILCLQRSSGQVILDRPWEPKIWIREPKGLAGGPQPCPLPRLEHAGQVPEQFGEQFEEWEVLGHAVKED
jgi:hypothetical protein